MLLYGKYQILLPGAIANICQDLTLAILNCIALSVVSSLANIEVISTIIGTLQLKLKKTLWPLFMDGVQLSQSYRATSRRQFTFYHLSLQEFLVLIRSVTEG